MGVPQSQLKACRECGVVWDTIFHPNCPNGHIGVPHEINWEK